jgi:hypothetical protein
LKKLFVLVMCVMLLVLVGCGKKSSLEGKVVDGKGKPLAGIKLLAMQEQPLKGYEKFECTSGTDGSFRFGKLFPTSAYQLITFLSDAPSDFVSETIMSAPEGQTMILPEPISIQKSNLVGKVVDGKGKPLAGVKLHAIQLQPRDKGNGTAMSTSGADGSFKFTTLFPNATFILSPLPATEPRVEIVSGPEGQTKTLPEPLIIRFQIQKGAATTLDTKTGLMWSNDANIAGKRMSWNEAMEWVRGLDIDGHKDWRLPSKLELLEFGKTVDIGSNYKNVQTDWYWTNTESGNSKAWRAAMYAGKSNSYENKKSEQHYVWPIRTGQ